MGLFDKVRKLAEDNADKLGGAVDKVAEVVDDKTGRKYSDQIDSGADKAKDFLVDLGDEKGTEGSA